MRFIRTLKRLPLILGKKDLLGTSGFLTCRFREKEGDEWTELWTKPVPNLILDDGIAQAVLLWGDDTGDAYDYGAVGEGTTAATASDTALESEVDRQAAAFTQETTTITDDTGKWVTTHTAPGGGWDITEYALVTAAAAGILYNRVVFAAIALAEGNQLEFTYKSQLTKV